MPSLIHAIDDLINRFYTALFGEFKSLKEAKQLACYSGLTADQLNAIIWAEQMGLAKSKVHQLPCFQVRQPFPDEREIAQAGGITFAGN